MNTDMTEHETDATSQMQFKDIIIGAVYTIAEHPVLLVVYVGLALILSLAGRWVLLSLGGPTADLRRVATLIAMLAARTPLDALIDAGALGSLLAAYRNERITPELVLNSVYKFGPRLFVIGVVALVVYIAGLMLFCIPLILCAAWYLRFIAVYVVWADCSVGESFREGTSVVLKPESWFMPVYLIATTFLAVIDLSMAVAGEGVRGLNIDMLGNVILVYVDLVVICTSFMLFNRMRNLEERR